MKPLFVTGTDTGVGKTVVATALLQALGARGLRVAGMKPVASGSLATPAGLRSEDALALQRQATVRTRYVDVNPYAFAPAIAPHVAAAEVGVEIDLLALEHAFERLALVSDLVVIEGAGGWLTPLSAAATLADFATAIDARVILVVGLRLGCLNHALLTLQGIERAGLPLAAWVGNRIDPSFERCLENVRTLQARLRAPRLALIEHGAALEPHDLARHLDLAPLLDEA